MRFRGTARAMDVGRIMQDQRPRPGPKLGGGGVGRGFMRVPGILQGFRLRDQKAPGPQKGGFRFRV